MWGQERWGLEAQRAPFPERTATWEFLLDPRPPEAGGGPALARRPVGVSEGEALEVAEASVLPTDVVLELLHH